MGINAVKGVEIGAGFGAAALTGEANADEMRMKDGEVAFLSNQAGGILGGISSGQDIVVRFAVKPTSSIVTPRRTVTTRGRDAEISTRGRHDPCVGIRAVPVGEAMVACVLADHLLRPPRAVRIAPPPAGQPSRAAPRRNSTLPALPVIGLSSIPRSRQPGCAEIHEPVRAADRLVKGRVGNDPAFADIGPVDFELRLDQRAEPGRPARSARGRPGAPTPAG